MQTDMGVTQEQVSHSEPVDDLNSQAKTQNPKPNGRERKLQRHQQLWFVSK